MTYKLKFLSGVLFMLISSSIYAGYGIPVKLSHVESQGAEVSIYVDGNIGDPAGCAPGVVQSQAFINADEGLQRSYSAALTAVAAQRDVQLLLSTGACKYNKPVVLGIRIK